MLFNVDFGLRQVRRALREGLRGTGYNGPLSVDAILYRTERRGEGEARRAGPHFGPASRLR